MPEKKHTVNIEAHDKLVFSGSDPGIEQLSRVEEAKRKKRTIERSKGKPNGTPRQSNSVTPSVIPTDREMDEWLEFLQR